MMIRPIGIHFNGIIGFPPWEGGLRGVIYCHCRGGFHPPYPPLPKEGNVEGSGFLGPRTRAVAKPTSKMTVANQ